jgi:hypothetical protein
MGRHAVPGPGGRRARGGPADRGHQQATVVTAGGRVDIEVVAPRDGSGARVQVGSSTWVDVGGRAPTAMPPPPRQLLHLLSYGSPAPLGFDPSTAVRHVTYDIGRRPG